MQLFSFEFSKNPAKRYFQSEYIQILTSILGRVIVTCSPLPTSSSPSQEVSIEAGLKSSKNRDRYGFLQNETIAGYLDIKNMNMFQ